MQQAHHPEGVDAGETMSKCFAKKAEIDAGSSKNRLACSAKTEMIVKSLGTALFGSADAKSSGTACTVRTQHVRHRCEIGRRR